MSKPTLISLSHELLDLTRQREDILIEAQGLITVENEAMISELEFRIKSLLVQNKDKVTNYVGFLDSLEIEMAYCKQKVEEVQRYVKRLENTKEWLENTAKMVIESTGKPLLGNFGNRISLRKSKSVQINCPVDSLPEEYKRIKTTVEADKKSLKEDLEAGVEIEGVSIVEKSSVQWK